MKKYILLLILLLIPLNIYAKDKVNIYLFYSESCTHCHNSDRVINEILETRDDINYYKYEVTLDQNAYNRTLYNRIKTEYNIDRTAYPTVIIGNTVKIGFGANTKNEYIELIDYYKKIDYEDKAGIITKVIESTGNDQTTKKEEYIYKFPIIGNVNLQKLSLPLLSMVIGFTDGFNPCAMWVLIFLITMLLNIKDKKKMWILGLTFIFTSGFIYFLFMMAWLELTDYINKITLLRNLIAIFSISFGLYNLYNYYINRKNDGCTIIKKEKRRFVFSNIRNILEKKSLLLSIIGIIILATIVNLIELLCSMGLPIMYTEILSLNNLNQNMYYIYLLIYIFFFLLDDIFIFTISMITLKEKAFNTKYNNYSHLIGGIIMILIGLLLLFKPGWLSFNF